MKQGKSDIVLYQFPKEVDETMRCINSQTDRGLNSPTFPQVFPEVEKSCRLDNSDTAGHARKLQPEVAEITLDRFYTGHKRRLYLINV